MAIKPSTIFAYIALFTAVFSTPAPNNTGHAAAGVDVAIVIALDVSASVSQGEFDLMREGLARAVTSPEVANAITHGQTGAISLSVVQWSGFTEQKTKINWFRASNIAELNTFADRIRSMARRYDGGATDIGGALEFSRDLVLNIPYPATRLVIDLVGDGPNNVNYAPDRERDITLKTGIVINGLAIVGEVPVLVDYFKDFIIGGDGAFVEKTSDFDGFERAMRRKLVREIGALLLF